MKSRILVPFLILGLFVSCSNMPEYFAYVENSEICHIDNNYEEKCEVVEEVDGLDFHKNDSIDFMSMPKPDRRNY